MVMHPRHHIGTAKCGGYTLPDLTQKNVDRKSIVFDSALGNYLRKEQVNGDNMTFTIVATFKRNSLGGDQCIMAPNSLVTGQAQSHFVITPDNRLNFVNGTRSVLSTAYLTDTSAWYTVMAVSTPTDMQMWVNGKNVSDTHTSSTLLGEYWNTTGYRLFIGRLVYTNGNNADFRLDANMTMIGLHDGYAHEDMSDFGYYDYVSEQWIPKDPNTTEWGGANSFYLSCKEDTQDDFFNTLYYNGDQPIQYMNDITPSGVDMAIVKRASASTSWIICDDIRGDDRRLMFNTSTAEEFNDGSYIGFIDGGVRVGSSTTVNADGDLHYLFTLKDDPSKGFTRVRYTGTDGTQELSHGLNKKPKFAIIKNMTNNGGWVIWIDGITVENNQYFEMNNSAMISGSTNTMWDVTRIDTSIFTVNKTNANLGVNNLNDEYIAYFFTDAENFIDIGFIPPDTIASSPGATNTTKPLIFDAEGNKYLFAQRYYNGNTHILNSYLYKLNKITNTWEEVTSILTGGAFSADHFEYNGNHYVFVAFRNTDNGQAPSGNVYVIDSRLYRFDPATDTFSSPIQTIQTTGCENVTMFTNNSKPYMLLNYVVDGATYLHNQPLYEWDINDDGTEQFSLIDSVPGQGGTDWVTFVENDITYCFLCNAQSANGVFNVNSELFKFDSTQGSNGELVSVTTIATNQATSADTFTFGDVRYLVISNYNANSVTFYSFNADTETFTLRQTITATQAIAARIFSKDGAFYLFISCHDSGGIDSYLYKFNAEDRLFELKQTLPLHGMYRSLSYTNSDDTYLYVSNYRVGSSYMVNSPIYRLNSTRDKLYEIDIYQSDKPVKMLLQKAHSAIGSWNIYYDINFNTCTNAQLDLVNIPDIGNPLITETIEDGIISSASLANRFYMAFYDTSFLSDLLTSDFGSTRFESVFFTGWDNYSNDTPFDNHSSLRYQQHRAATGPSIINGGLELFDSSGGAHGQDQLYYGASASRRLFPGQVFEVNTLVATTHSSGNTPLVVFTEMNRNDIHTVSSYDFRADLGYRVSTGVFGFYVDIRQPTLHTTTHPTGNVPLAAGDILTVHRTDADLVAYINGVQAASIAMDKSFPPLQVHFATFGPGSGLSVNFGQRPFVYPPAEAYKTMSSLSSLDGYAIDKPNEFFNVVDYTGTETTQAISDVNFSPDLTILKDTGNNTNWAVIDVVRGLDRAMVTNLSSSESTSNGSYLTAVNDNGFILDGTGGGYNINGNNYKAYCFRQSVCSGFAVRTWDGTGGAKVINHGLGREVDVAWIKARDISDNWRIYFKPLTTVNTNFLAFNNANGLDNTDPLWDFPAMNASNFGLLDAANLTSSRWVGYFWTRVPGFSDFGLYMGGGSGDPVYIECGFKPALVIIKAWSTNGFSWILKDNRMGGGQNEFTDALMMDNNNPISIVHRVDFLSNGFRVEADSGHLNVNGREYFYMAFADVNDILTNAR